MKVKFERALIFVALVALCWGMYGPMLHQSKVGFSGSILYPFLLVCFAYFMICSFFIWLLGKFKLASFVKSEGPWPREAIIKGLGAGMLGAIGSFGLLLALKFYPNPLVVMPIVFGCVEAGNCVATSVIQKRMPERNFLIGILLLIVGVVVALSHKPGAGSAHSGDFHGNLYAMLGCVAIITAAWGSYGSAVHASNVAFKGQSFRTTMMIGLSYTLCAIPCGLAILANVDGGAVSDVGLHYGFLAGGFTSLGAIFTVLAIRHVTGGPNTAMPLIFAGAPIVNSFYSIYAQKVPFSDIHILFWGGVVLCMIGAYIVFASKPTVAHK